MDRTSSTRKRLAAVSTAALLVWAKHEWRRDDPGADSWLPLWCHMADSTEAVAMLWDRWLPRRTREHLAAELPRGEADARLLVRWLAAVHDIGKCTPAFACQVEHLAQDMTTRGGLTVPTQKSLGNDRSYAPHGLAGQVLLRDWLVEQHGWDKRRTYQLTVIIGGHHGVQPDAQQEKDLLTHPELLRTPDSAKQWRGVQEELLTACAQATGAAERLAEWRTVALSQPVQVLLSALVIVADWIASNTDFYPLAPGSDLHSPNRGADAWHSLGLPGPWRPVPPPRDPEVLLRQRFKLPAGAVIHPVQEQTVRAAQEMSGPGLVMVEAPMGEGKTEAAFAAAEILAERTGAGGCFVALPTMATGNAIRRWCRRRGRRAPRAAGMVPRDSGQWDTALIQTLGSRLVSSWRVKGPPAEQIESCAPESGSLERFDPAHVALHRAGVPRQGQARDDRVEVLA